MFCYFRIEQTKSPFQSLLGQQIAWEETHSGGYRRVLLSSDNPSKYCQFFVVQNQASIFFDTAASKRREEAAKQLRNTLIEKQKQILQIPNFEI